MIGTLVVNEKIYPVQRVTLGGGAFLIHAGPIPGPAALPAESEVRLHGLDGGLVLVAPWRLDRRQRSSVAGLNPGDTATIVLPVSMSEVRGWPRPQPGEPNPVRS